MKKGSELLLQVDQPKISQGVVSYTACLPRNPKNPKIRRAYTLVAENLLVYGLKYASLEFVLDQFSRLFPTFRERYARYFLFAGMASGAYGLWRGARSVTSLYEPSNYKKLINDFLASALLSVYAIGNVIYLDLYLNPDDAQPHLSDARVFKVLAGPLAFSFILYLGWQRGAPSLISRCDQHNCWQTVGRTIDYFFKWLYFTSIIHVPFKVADPVTPVPIVDASKKFIACQLVPPAIGLVTIAAYSRSAKRARQTLDVIMDTVTAGFVGAETYYAVAETDPPVWLLIIRVLFLLALVSFGLAFTVNKARKIYKRTELGGQLSVKELTDDELVAEGLSDQVSKARLVSLSKPRGPTPYVRLADSGDEPPSAGKSQTIPILTQYQKMQSMTAGLKAAGEEPAVGSSLGSSPTPGTYFERVERVERVERKEQP